MARTPDAPVPVTDMTDRELLEEIVFTLRLATDAVTSMMDNPMLAMMLPQGDPVAAALSDRR